MANKRLVDGSSALKEKKYNVITIEATKQPEQIKLRVAAYARVSSDSSDQESSFAAQTRYYTQLITGNPEWKFVDVYADEGITGTSMEKRDDFKRLVADCRRGLIDKVLVKSISRFARNTTECLSITRELKQLGIGVVFEKEGIDTSSVSSELMTTVFASFAQRESESISSNARLGFQMRLKNKTYVPAYLPYGFIRVENQICPHPEQAVVIRRIFQEYLSGKSVEAIAKGLRDDGIPSKSGKVAWDTTVIRYIITNEKYKGDSLWQKGPLQAAILTALNRAMSNKAELVKEIAGALSMEMAPVLGESMSIADIDRRLAEISTETMAIVTAASSNGGQSREDTLKLKELVDEAALLRKKKAAIQSAQDNNPSASLRLAKAAEVLEEVDNHITYWDECMIRQLVETVKVVSATKIEVSLQGGTVIEQEVKNA